MAFTDITVTSPPFLLADGSPARGTIRFTPTAPMRNAGTVVKAPVAAVLDAAGRVKDESGDPLILKANTDPDTTPADPFAAYRVVEVIRGQPVREYTVRIAHDAASATVDLTTLSTLEAPGYDLPTFSLADAVDVASTAPSDGEVLTYDSGTSAWRPEAAAVASVNGATGAVVLDAADVAADAAGTATTAVAAHVAASDPHGDRAYADAGDVNVPAHAGARTRRYDATRSLYGATAATLRRLRAALGKARDGSSLTRLAVLGDSLSAGVGATPGSTDPYRALRRILSGLGYSVGDIAHLANLTTDDARVSTSGIDATTGGATAGFPWYGGTGSLTYTSDVAGTVVEIVTSGESGAFDYNVDAGTLTGTYTPSGTPNVLETVTLSGLADTTHAVVVTANGGAAYLAGIGVRPAQGVVLQNCGISGSTANDWAASLGYGYGPLSIALHDSPDVAVIELMMNDYWNGRTAVQFASDMNLLLDAVQTASAEPLLVVSQRPDDAGAPYDAFVSAVYDVADAQGVMLLDLADAYGALSGYVALGLAASDPHLTVAGYAMKADLLAGALLPTVTT